MIIKPALAAMIASGLIIPEKPKLVFSKPAIVKSENLDFLNNKHLAMPLTMGIVASSRVPYYTYNGNYNSASDLTTYSFTGCNFGSARSDRLIAVVIQARASPVASRTLSSITIGGVTGTVHVENTISGVPCVIASALVPTGTSGTVSLTWSAGMGGVSISLYSMYNLSSNTPNGSWSNTWSSGNCSTAVAVKSNGILLAATTVGGTNAVTYTTITKDWDFQFTIDSGVVRTTAGGSATISSSNSSLSITATCSGNTAGVLSVAAWR